MRKVCGATLALLTIASAVLAIAGIWGAIPGDTALQLLGTFVVVGGAANGVTYIAEKFFP